MLGVYKGAEVSGVFPSHALEIDKVDIALAASVADTWSGVESLAGKRVGAVRGYGYDKFIDVQMRYKEGAQLKSLVKMLNHGRLEAVIDYAPDIDHALNQINESKKYVIKKSVIAIPTYAVFANTKNGKHMLDIFNNRIVELHNSGRLQEIMMKNLGVLSKYPL